MILRKVQPPEILPPTEGFFFGEYEYDEWYFKELKNTIDQLNRILDKFKDWDIHYQSSW